MSNIARNVPLAYLITFRTYGTWLHGDSRGSIDRYQNDYATPAIPPDPRWYEYNCSRLAYPPVTLDARGRRCVDASVRTTCAIRGWTLHALNVRTNHVHVVVSAARIPERVLCDLKAYATRCLREAKCLTGKRTPWADGGSTRYLWTESSLARAIAYVVDGQGPALD